MKTDIQKFSDFRPDAPTNGRQMAVGGIFLSSFIIILL